VAPARFLADLERLRRVETRPVPALQLIGRRDLRSNNSWMHNYRRLVKGKERCTLMIHSRDAAARGLRSGALARVTSRAGAVEVPVEVTDDVRAGVVSLPHGWGHLRPGTRLAVAGERPGASLNDLTDEQVVDELCGTAAFSGVPVEVAPVAAAAAGETSETRAGETVVGPPLR
jgi:anaerobic selenocysteine-containing dehydrogenase